MLTLPVHHDLIQVFMESVLFIYVFFWVLVWPCQLFVRLWYRVSDVLDLSLVSKRFGFWPHITHVSVNFQRNKAFVGLSDYRTVGLSDCRTIGLSDYRLDPHAWLVDSKNGSHQFCCYCQNDRFLCKKIIANVNRIVHNKVRISANWTIDICFCHVTDIKYKQMFHLD